MSPRDRHYLGEKFGTKDAETKETPGAEEPLAEAPTESPGEEPLPAEPLASASGEFIGPDGRKYRRCHEQKGSSWRDWTEPV